jgi:hypothetical protein
VERFWFVGWLLRFRLGAFARHRAAQTRQQVELDEHDVSLN